MKRDKFDRAATRFLKRVRRTQPQMEQVSAVTGSLLQQMDPEEVRYFVETVMDRFRNEGAA
ncbi:hypothetical protein [Terrabacter terrigena]|uniref:Uncharacterized protein n=1 Tax=Terrabacter terrigena TaxID=574718 RepID=A0ABW3MXM3_9MICO